MAWDPVHWYKLAAVQCIKDFAFLGWLCGGEVLIINKDDVTSVTPDCGLRQDLPVGTGFLSLLSNALTKLSQDQIADVSLAYEPFSSL